MINDTQTKLLLSGLDYLNITLSEHQINQIERYIVLLLKWNKTYNLTAITDIDDIINYHILDAFTVIRFLNENDTIKKEKIIDVGSGMGIPGVILAIYYHNHSVTLLDSNGKKTAFLTQVGITLKLTNLKVIHKRIENFTPHNKFNLIISRAFTDTALFVKLTVQLLNPDGVIIAMKSSRVQDELQPILDCYHVSLIKTAIPNLSDIRYLVMISNLKQ